MISVCPKIFSDRGRSCREVQQSSTRMGMSVGHVNLQFVSELLVQHLIVHMGFGWIFGATFIKKTQMASQFADSDRFEPSY